MYGWISCSFSRFPLPAGSRRKRQSWRHRRSCSRTDSRGAAGRFVRRGPARHRELSWERFSDGRGRGLDHLTILTETGTGAPVMEGLFSGTRSILVRKAVGMHVMQEAETAPRRRMAEWASVAAVYLTVAIVSGIRQPPITYHNGEGWDGPDCSVVARCFAAGTQPAAEQPCANR